MTKRAKQSERGNVLSRILTLIQMMADSEPIGMTTNDIKDKLDVCSKTARRYMQYIANAGVPVYSDADGASYTRLIRWHIDKHWIAKYKGSPKGKPDATQR